MGLQVGDRVEVLDPGLTALRDIMRRSGHEPAPNHHGEIAEVWEDEGEYLIYFDDGIGAPYPFNMVRRLDADR